MQIEAAVSREGAEFPALETVQLEDPRAGEVLVRLVATGVCHTDISVHGGYSPTPKPVVLGHEGAGIVERVGDGVTSLRPGDHVVLGSNSCGTCAMCEHSHPTYCYELMQRNFGGARPDGTTPLSQDGTPIHARFFGQSSFATHSLADAHAAIKVDPDLPLELLGPLGCGVHTGAGAVINSLGVGPGQSIAIFGTGSVGLSAVMAARLVGAERIVAVDVVPSRLDVARGLGATETIDPTASDPVAAILELTGGHGVEFSLNTTGIPEVYAQGIACLDHLGVAGYVTGPRGPFAPDMFHLMAGRSLRGIIGGDAVPSVFIPQLIEHWRAGRLPFERLITEYPFARIADAFADSEAGTTIKPVLRMPG